MSISGINGYWAAPRASGPLDAHVSLPGSKSLTARALVLAALACEPTELTGTLVARDTELMVGALRSMGVDIRPWPPSDTQGRIVISPPPQLGSNLPLTFIDCGLAGTVMRFAPLVAAQSQGTYRFDGDPHARNRPMKPLVNAMKDLGIEITADADGQLPMTLQGRGGAGSSGPKPGIGVEGGSLEIMSTSSSQFISALLLAAPRFNKGLDLSVQGDVPSAPHILMTVRALQERGVRVHELTAGGHPVAPGVTPVRWRVEPGQILGGKRSIEPDLSNAGPFLAAAGICGGTVRIENWPRETTQAGAVWPEILSAMGMDIELQDGTLYARATGTLKGIEKNLGHVGELVPTVAALAAFAQGPSKITGIGHLRGHETDRLAAITQGLRAVGVGCQELADGLLITPSQSDNAVERPDGKPKVIRAYADHRMATFGALLGLRVPNTYIDDIACTSKTLPQFPTMWAKMLDR
ncbi:MAG: 3-phosphoshikimate 1-carboxyvinyltransferase [Actinomycetaceae bacterium]|nr:3-phosphoshikimate 1-carboxyvinyltransferase [Actinomycetaceae bacterium]